MDRPNDRNVETAGRSVSPPVLPPVALEPHDGIRHTPFGSPRQDDKHFRKILENLPIAVYTTDAEGRITFYNEAAATLWGRHPTLGEERWYGSSQLSWPDGTPIAYGECPMAMAIKTGESAGPVEALASRPDGTRYPFVGYPTPLRDDDGNVIGALNVLMEISERKRTEEAAQRLVAIVESSADAIVSKDLNGVINSWNQGAERLFGYTASEVIGMPITILLPADRDSEETSILARIRKGEVVPRYDTIRQRKDGSLVDISLTVSPIRNADGRIIGASKIARDITERKRAEKGKELVLHEIQHRVRNTLGIVQALAAQTFRNTSRGEGRAFSARLQALAGAHELLTRENSNRAMVGEVVERTLAPFQEQNSQRIHFSGPEAQLNWNKAVQLAMVLHELATNAVKYGALSNERGRVDVTWEQVDGNVSQRQLRIVWSESGGPHVKPPKRKGFGSTLVERALDGTDEKTRLEFFPRGVQCTLEINL